MPRNKSTHDTIQDCLKTLEISTDELLTKCQNDLTNEFKFIKKQYFQKVLVCHPDKGGDAETFREVQSCFEVIRELYQSGKISSFVVQHAEPTAEAFDTAYQDFEGKPTPSWDYYYEAAEESVPLYRMEIAKSNRSKCDVAKRTPKKCAHIQQQQQQQQKARGTTGSAIERGQSTAMVVSEAKDAPLRPEFIPKNEVRVGVMDPVYGSYTKWVHLKCWRVPSKIWLGLPDPTTTTNDDPVLFADALSGMNEVLICGFDELSEEKRRMILGHVMEKSNWAKLVKRKVKNRRGDSNTETTQSFDMPAPPRPYGSKNGAIGKAYSQTIVPMDYHKPREIFLVPTPGQDGYIVNSLAGKRVVLTGTFPELGGGAGLNLGKDKLKKMIELFGGRVTSAVSGLTDILVVGKDEGATKVSKAMAQSKCRLMSLKEFKESIHDGSLIETGEKPKPITSSSSLNAGALEFKPGNFASILPVDEIENKRNDAYVVIAAKKKSTPTNIKRKAKTSKPIPKRGRQPKKEAFNVACDGCGVDCTARSFFVAVTDNDYCETCGKEKGGVLQCNGVAVR